jgi:hypothetical protein
MILPIAVTLAISADRKRNLTPDALRQPDYGCQRHRYIGSITILKSLLGNEVDRSW